MEGGDQLRGKRGMGGGEARESREQNPKGNGERLEDYTNASSY